MKMKAADFLSEKGPSPRRLPNKRRGAQEALRESEARFKTIFEYSPVAIFVTDLESMVIDANPAACQLHGSKRDELVGQSVLGLFPQQEKRNGEGDGPKLRRTRWSSTQSFAARKQGEAIPIAVTASRIEYAGRDAVLLHVRDISEQKRAEAQLRNSREQLRALSRRMQNAREKERRRIAREVHDEVGQALTGLKMDVAWLGKQLVEQGDADWNPKFLSKIESMSGVIEATMHVVRKIATELRPSVLDALGLVPTIEWQGQEFQNRTGIRCSVRVAAAGLKTKPEISTAIFRILQEILGNVARHAKASAVKIDVKEKPPSLILEVRDNGRGIKDLEICAPDSLGLLGIRERALAFGGEVKIRGAAGKGTTITVYVPRAAEAAS